MFNRYEKREKRGIQEFEKKSRHGRNCRWRKYDIL